MSSLIKVDTAQVKACANNISELNQNIRDDFSDVVSAIKSLDSEWVGSASTSAMHAFYEIKNNFSNPRYAVMNDYVKFLRQLVDDGYSEVETVNKSLADAFK